MIQKNIELPAEGVFGQFQSTLALEENINILKEQNTTVILDLSKVSFLEITCQILLLVIIDKRVRERKVTLLNLPDSKKVREALRIWEFPAAIKKVSGYWFIDSVTKGSKRYFGEEERNTQKISPINDLLPKNVLEITTFTKNFDSGMALSIAADWKQESVGKVFDCLFKGSAKKFAKNVIYEAFVNSIRHPHASTIVLASSLQVTKSGSYNLKAQDGYLTFIIWDNGDSIIETLKNGMEKNENIRIWKDDIFSCVFHVKDRKDTSDLRYKPKHNSKLKFTPFNLNHDFEPSNNDPDHTLLASSFLPGISSNPEKENKFHYPERCSEVSSLNQPGMGLYQLANTVVQEFGGRVFFRTKNRYITISKTQMKNDPDQKPHFDCSIGVNKDCDVLSGNLLIVKIPVRNDYNK